MIVKDDDPAILIEVLPSYGQIGSDRHQRQQAIDTIFEMLGFDLFRVRFDTRARRVRFLPVDSVSTSSNMNDSNYLAISQKTAEALSDKNLSEIELIVD